MFVFTLLYLMTLKLCILAVNRLTFDLLYLLSFFTYLLTVNMEETVTLPWPGYDGP